MKALTESAALAESAEGNVGEGVGEESATQTGSEVVESVDGLPGAKESEPTESGQVAVDSSELSPELSPELSQERSPVPTAEPAAAPKDDDDDDVFP